MLTDPLVIAPLMLDNTTVSTEVNLLQYGTVDVSPGRTSRLITSPSLLPHFIVGSDTSRSVTGASLTIAHSLSKENPGMTTTRASIRFDATHVVKSTGLKAIPQATLTFSLPGAVVSSDDVLYLIRSLLGFSLGLLTSSTSTMDIGAQITRVLAGEP